MISVFRNERAYAVALLATLLAATILTAVVGRGLGPHVEPYFIVAAITSALANLFTAFLLFAQCKAARRPEFGLLAMGYAYAGFLTFPYLAGMVGPLASFGHPSRNQQASPFLYLCWHVAFPIVALVGTRLAAVPHGARIDSRMASRSTATALVATALAVVATVAVAIVAGDALPRFVENDRFLAPWRVGMALVIALSAVAALELGSRRDQYGSFHLWLVMVLYAAALEGILNLVSGMPYSYAFDLGKIVSVAASLLVIGRLSFDNVRMYARSSDLIDEHAQHAAARIRAIWQIATSDGLSERDFVQVALDVAVANMRTASDVFGFVSHLRSGDVVIDAVSMQGDPRALAASARAYVVGSAFDVASDVHARLVASGRTVMWHGRDDFPPSLRCADLGWQNAIGTPITIGAETHFLIVAVLATHDDARFAETDGAFIDVVASNIGHRFYQRANLERVRFQNEHDALTGLYNRIQCLRLGRTGIAQNRLEGIALIDIDHLQAVNARLGQLGGDAVLVELAASLRGVDERDTVCRFGGDEFAVIMHRDATGRSFDSRVAAYRTAFGRPLLALEGGEASTVSMSASIGSALWHDGVKIEALIARAGIALDRAKDRPGDGIVTYADDMRGALEHLASQRADLLRAIERDEFRLEYQPTIAMHDRSIVGAEALIRWQHPTRGLLAPGQFLDDAERADVMGPLTGWVIHRVARDLASIALPAGFRCYVNVTARVLEDAAFLAHIEDELRASPELGARLGVEVTESEVMSNVERAIATLTTVRRLGLLVAIDDFGTGYSSLSYLKRLPIDVVKLDKSFIDGLPDNPGDVALAEMFVELTRRFALVSVAEGIETEDQARWLTDHGCLIGQGYLFSRPVPFARLEELLVNPIAAAVASRA
ncbi:MAG: hypothetical protein NVS1B2_03530 [Vulcanimicrobiaceae bacterium]